MKKAFFIIYLATVAQSLAAGHAQVQPSPKSALQLLCEKEGRTVILQRIKDTVYYSVPLLGATDDKTIKELRTQALIQGLSKYPLLETQAAGGSKILLQRLKSKLKQISKASESSCSVS